jgi:hypothetical protein
VVYYQTLRSKAEVKSLVALVGSSLNVMLFFVFAHRAPNVLTVPIEKLVDDTACLVSDTRTH